MLVATDKLPRKFLAPAKSCAAVETKPTFVASAFCKYKVEPLMWAPFALLVGVSIVPMVFTAVPPPVGVHVVPL